MNINRWIHHHGAPATTLPNLTAATVRTNKLDFGDALHALKTVDPNWETWYDREDAIPDLIQWTDTTQVRIAIDAIQARAQEKSREQQLSA